eukprot:2743823-Pleurochrysis_carterae.AAC.1
MLTRAPRGRGAGLCWPRLAREPRTWCRGIQHRMLLQLPSAGTADANFKVEEGLSKSSLFADVLAVTYELPTGTGDAEDDERSAACASAKHHKPRDKAVRTSAFLLLYFSVRRA